MYSTLKPCAMCAGVISDASGGNAKVFWGQDDPGKMAAAKLTVDDVTLSERDVRRVADGAFLG